MCLTMAPTALWQQNDTTQQETPMIRRILSGLAILAVAAAPALAEPTRFSVTVTGEGADVILVPGLGSSADVWTQTVEQLAPAHRVHLVQVSGFAGAEAGGNADGPVLPGLVEELAAYAETLDKPAIIGHSMGGLAAVELAAAHPDAVSRVMVVDSLPFYGLMFSAQATVAAIAPQAAGLRDQLLAMDKATYDRGQDQSLNIMAKSPEALAKVKAWSVASDKSVVARALYDVMTTDARPRLSAITKPVTVVYAYDPQMGRTGAAVTAMYIDAYAGVEKSELKRIDGGYHFIMLDQPAAFAEAVTAFLAKPANGGALKLHGRGG